MLHIYVCVLLFVEGNRLSVRLPPDTIPKGSVWIPGKYDHLIDPKQAHKRVMIIINITLRLRGRSSSQ